MTHPRRAERTANVRLDRMAEPQPLAKSRLG